MTHRGPQTAMREKDKIIHPHFDIYARTHMHLHECVEKKADRDTNPKTQRLHTYTPTANRDKKYAFCQRHKYMVSESAKLWAALNIRAALLCNLKVS